MNYEKDTLCILFIAQPSCSDDSWVKQASDSGQNKQADISCHSKTQMNPVQTSGVFS
jgi:hypothetical protein